jgi:hypothetical protein
VRVFETAQDKRKKIVRERTEAVPVAGRAKLPATEEIFPSHRTIIWSSPRRQFRLASRSGAIQFAVTKFLATGLQVP